MRAENDYRTLLQRRLAVRPRRRLDVLSTLRHFALINYALPKARLEPYIPTDRYTIPEFAIGGSRLALMSAVPFVDVDFHFPGLFPFLRFRFGQTNYRVYVIDRQSGEHGVWFFGTTLGSPVVYVPRNAWKIPWHYARYQIACDYDRQLGRYRSYEYAVASSWASARISLHDTGEPVASAEGFASREEMLFVLTHPVEGYFYRTDGKLGSYSVWHEELRCTVGQPQDLYFSLYERLGLLSREEMQRPHSVFICPETVFTVHLPPRVAA
jgi:hypothetical protein